jgi:hypothetical protein
MVKENICYICGKDMNPTEETINEEAHDKCILDQ